MLLLWTAFPPLILLAGLGRLRAATLAVWFAGACVLLAGLGVHDLRAPVDVAGGARRTPSLQLLVFGAAALYIVHHLIEPADVERTVRPSYRGRFESAWRHGFQLALSLAFTAVLWGLLWLGAALFQAIGVPALSRLLGQRWFIFPVTGAAFAAALHLTDVRPALIEGVRTVVLTLLAWLMPVLVGLAAAFLVTTAATGLAPLWRTRWAAGSLLSAVAWLVVLLNAAYQDGRDREALPAVLRWSGRAGAWLLVPLTALAGWAVALRIGQYGLTPERVVSLAALAAAAVYAGGYAGAALARGAWMRGLETVNVVAAAVAVGLTTALPSPLADPARLATVDQVARLQSGRVPPARFDWTFLRFRAARYGRKALASLARSPRPEIAEQARRAQATPVPWRPGPPAAAGEPAFSHARLVGAGPLPPGFREQAWTRADTFGTACLVDGTPCDLLVVDLAAAPGPEVLVSSGASLVLFGRGEDGRWGRLGDYRPSFCDPAQAAISRGDVRAGDPGPRDLLAGRERLVFSPAFSGGCRSPVRSPERAAPGIVPSPPAAPGSRQ